MAFFEVPKLNDILLEREFPNLLTDKINSHPLANSLLTAIAGGLERRYLGIHPEMVVTEYSFRSHIHIPPYHSNDRGYFRVYNPNGHSTVVVLPQRGRGYNFARLVASYLAANGFTVYEVVTPFHERRLPEGIKSVAALPISVDFLKTMSKQSIEEVLSLIEFIGKDVGIVGVSQGAGYAVVVSSLESRVKGSVYVHGFANVTDLLYDSEDTLAKKFRQQNSALLDNPDTLRGELNLIDPITYARGDSTYRAIMINGKNDNSLPENNVLALWEALGRPRLHFLIGGHGLVVIRTKKILKLTLDHLDKTLK